MDVLKPGHAHRSSSDRLLNNYLQKSLSTSLLTLLSHSHSSTSSLLAYVTSSPGVIPTIRRSVRHAAFEGPLSPGMTEGSQLGSEGEGGWAAYILSLDQFRKDLKQIHLLEEEISRVKRDREILVGRLIKATKGRPTKSDLSALATTYNAQFDDPRSSRASVMSDSSSNTKAGKREGKLADAQAELLGCEEHLRGLEVRIEAERNKVMTRGLEQRFRAMEVVGRMWVQQAKRGLSDLDRMQDLPPDAFELDSNGSLAPSQSASQVAYDDVPRPHSRGAAPYPRHLQPEFAGSIDGSIAEENEDSSDEDMNGLQVHENHPGQQLSPRVPPKGREQSHPSGVPSIIDYSPKLGNRRAASDIGTGAYRPTPPRQSLLRTVSHDRGTSRQSRRAGSDTGSIREHKPKKKGFFTSIRTWFKGGKHHEERSSSPPYGSGGSKAGWQTRTDGNIKRGSTLRGSRPDESSSDESEGGNFVSVSNNQNSTWAVDHNRGAGSKVSRTTSMPLATGLIPSKPAKPTRSASQSTITAKPRPKSSLSRSGTVKSAMSDATVKSSGGTKKKTRPNGSIARSTVSTNGHHSQGAGTAGRNIMSLVDSSGPVMPEVPKAPRSGSDPNMHLPSAPGTSIVTADARVPTPKKATPSAATSAGPPTLGRSVSQKSTASKKKKKVEREGESEKDDKTWRPTTPLPPSRLLSPPLKSALRPTSPSPSPLPLALQEPVKPMYSISAPAPIPYEEVKQEQEREQLEIEEKEREKRAQLLKRNSYVSVQSDGASVYESAYEDEDQGTRGYGPEDTDSSDDEDGDYQVFKNEKHIRRGEMASGDPDYGKQYDDVGSDLTVGARSEHTTVAPTAPSLAPALEPPTETPRRRKSVRMAVPDSPVTEIIPSISPPPTAPGPVFGSPSPNSNQNPHPLSLSESQPAQAPRSRTPSPEPERVEQQWSTRIGRMREDTSDEEDDVPDYVKARKKLQRNSGKWEVDGKEEKKEKGLKKKGSVKSKGIKKLVKA
ncbi:hypothetical protein B9479_001323 [Cryptococcus floricola]|uniref:Uncharacterized protein n=1 Tax=Cryptococcus floricola TaxID=2591691 RepID=A0A5D3B2K2_9TREE|nr:hypothetical protein B9479_001323 [Cryptococcus floricola]